MGRRDERAPLVRALDAANGLKPGTWESVEALSVLALECGRSPEGVQILDAARAAAGGLKAGTWESVRALALLARAERELGSE